MAVQLILKKNAIMMFETLLPRLLEVEGVVCAKDPAVRSLRLKVAVAYLANGRQRESLTALT